MNLIPEISMLLTFSSMNMYRLSKYQTYKKVVSQMLVTGTLATTAPVPAGPAVAMYQIEQNVSLYNTPPLQWRLSHQCMLSICHWHFIWNASSS